jgi:protein-tyrosine phosphatase
MPPAVDQYILTPKEPVVVRRNDGNTLTLHWDGERSGVKVYAGHTPDCIDRTTPIAGVSGTNTLTLPGLDSAARQYFMVEFESGQTYLVAERQIPFERINNFRDLGGYLTADGRQVKWGTVYRSGGLFGATESDLERLQKLGVRLICDLRADSEVEQEPDVLPDGALYERTPVMTEDPISKSVVIRRRKELDVVMLEVYKYLGIDGGAAIFGEIFRQLADPENLPTLVHCTGGKDRTGIASALLLLFLGVPDDVVIADYTLSNYHALILFEQYSQRLKAFRWLGLTRERLMPLFVVQPGYIQETIDYVREKYGSVNAYLSDQAGVDQRTMSLVKANLLN